MDDSRGKVLLLKEKRTIPASFLFFLWLWAATSSIVLIEPAPYDLLFVVGFFLAIFFSLLSLPAYLCFPVFLLVMFINCNLLSLLMAHDLLRASGFFLINLYMCFIWFFLASLLATGGTKILDNIFRGYIIAALVAAIIGILAYFQEIPMPHLFLEWGRVSGTFKDPNVFAPFLVPIVLYSTYCLETKGGLSTRICWFTLLIVCLTGILLSFSRAAWANCLIALFIYFLLPSLVPTKQRIITLAVFLIMVLPLLFTLINHGKVNELFQLRTGLQEYDYDRFATHLEALKAVKSFPLGIGPGQAGSFFSYDVHNVFFMIAAENGLLAFFFFLWFLFLTLLRSFKQSYQMGSPHRHYSVIVTAALVGILFNSYFIDSLHWRHFWLLLALPWLPLSGSNRG